ncbi:hypothetical protein Sru01_21480 [Sphaerisporangium rufum]|uniref:Polysulfide reductase n=1 Tax=Sphaerisporangium rufum TaxID=1381558 RepID=A0A919QZV2_9ACTN|nr:NrfD/PsrC family molybdoenzyme membrane anchor subunit [Sphaerisporangium rufum]GII77166.1 hypothetical protein Sru01_21480 [Sphaerisporangium rufum]
MARERAMVPKAEFGSYYGQPIIKAPIWHEPHMPLYLYLGGLSGACGLAAAVEELRAGPGGPPATVARLAAAAAAAAGAGFLVAELGRPERFLNMLRVFKPTSPMSVGSWVLAAHGGATALAAGSAVTGLLPAAGRLAALASGLTGPVMSTYTAVLVADTAVPAWHEARRELPFLFAGSALAGAGAVGIVSGLARPETAVPGRRMAALGAAVETVASTVMERRLGTLADPYRQDGMMRAGRLLTAAGGVLAALAGLPAGPRGGSRRGQGIVPAGRGPAGGWPGSAGRASAGGPVRAARAAVAAARSGYAGARTASRPGLRELAGVAAAAALTAGAVCTRFGVLRAGRASAADPAYIVGPQRERLAARRAAEAARTPGDGGRTAGDGGRTAGDGDRPAGGSG